MNRPRFACSLGLFILAALVSSAASGMNAELPAPAATPAAAPVAPDAWLDPIAEQLADHYRTDGQWELELVRPFDVSADTIVEITELPPKPAGQMMLRLKLHLIDGTMQTAAIFVRAKVWRDAWVAREPLDRGGAIEPQLVEMRRVDFLRQHDLVPVDTDFSDLYMSRSLPAGRYLTWRDVARRPLVRKGEMIEVAAVDGRLAISMKALALQDGLAGELVRVRNLESRREFAVVVTAIGQAEVRF